MSASDLDTGTVPLLSVVFPVCNEAENLEVLLERVGSILERLGTYELVFVDDGSIDASAGIIAAAAERDSRVRLIRLSRNFGHQAALTAGIDHARGRAVALMDADLQDPPEVLPQLVARWMDGFDVVYAVRRQRKEGLLKRAAYRGFYRLLGRVASSPIALDAGDFCLMDRRVVDALRALPETQRFLRGLRGWVGFSQTGVPYDRPARHAGTAKYSWRSLTRLAIDGLVSFSSVPLRLATYLGLVTAAAAVIYLGVAIYARVVDGSPPEGWTSIVLVQLVLGSVQLLVMAILGTYIARVFDEVKRRPTYIVRPPDRSSDG